MNTRMPAVSRPGLAPNGDLRQGVFGIADNIDAKDPKSNL